jgi:pimeloyl-ACP methyl ester carboxylesterase
MKGNGILPNQILKATFMTYIRKISWVLLTLACIFCQVSNAQLQLSDAYDEYFLISAQPSYAIKSVHLSTGVQIEYAEQGKSTGIPVIFLHGYTDSWYSFEQVLQSLPESIHAYVLSQRGHGNSGKPVNSYKADDFAADIAAFMKQLKIESAVIVGHSMGGTVAQRFALDHPQLTKALVLVGALASYNSNPGIDELKKAVAQLKDPVDFGFAYEFQKSTVHKALPVEVVETYTKESMKVPAGIWKAITNQLMNGEYLEELREINIPTLLIWGNKDSFSRKADQEALSIAIKGSLLLIYDSVGHAIHWEDPKRFTTDLLDFIYTTEGNSVNTHEINFMENYSRGFFY